MAKSLLMAIGRGIALLWAAWAWLVQSLFGAWVWQAPRWALGLRRQSTALAARTRHSFSLHPSRFALGFCVVAALCVGGHFGWQWYKARPKPEYVSFSVTAPSRTRIEDDKAKPDPLTVRFDRSAAALPLAGKVIPAGVDLQPALAGTWRWLDDRVLEFRPREDWPVGQIYRAVLDQRILAPQIRLEDHAFQFSSAVFGAQVTSAAFYQDPVTPGVKMGVFDVQFTHPVDPAELERRVELRLAGQKEGVWGVGRETTPFTITYDKLKLNASIHSASLGIPHDQSRLQLNIAAGVRALGGGNRTAEPLTTSAAIPGLYSLSVAGIEPVMVNDEHDDPEQVLLVNLSTATGEREVGQSVKVWLLPTVRPAHDLAQAIGSERHPYHWYGTKEVTDDVLKSAPLLDLQQIPAEREYVESHSFKYHADVGRYLFVQVDKNLRSFGGYLLPGSVNMIVRVPPFPPQLKILSEGSLLALSGERKVAAVVRDLPGLRVEVARVLPEQLQHLVSQASGDFSNPSFYGSFGADNLTERFVRKIPLSKLPRGQAHYESIDLGEYLKGGTPEKRGIFLLTLQGYDPRAEAAQRRAAAARREQDSQTQPSADDDIGDRSADAEPEPEPDAGGLTDKRLVLLTDLGLLLKRSVDGSQDVFVQSIASGLPVAGATVEVIAVNGTSLVSQVSDAQGHAHFAKLDGLTRERAPLLVQVRKAGDFSFLPLNHGDRSLDFSRFDIGGSRSARSANQLDAFLFSDRGIYRPGDTLHIGMIVKTAKWSKDLTGLPLESEVLDARGLTVARNRFTLPVGGFAELSQTLVPTAPTGAYTINLYIVKDDHPDAQIGSTTVRVQEFEPDRMKISAHLSVESPDGWVSPKALKALVNVQNLFGTPAEQRRVEATLTLTPAFPAFHAFADYRFYDPQRAKEGYDNQLTPATTDTDGNVSFDLGLQQYAAATYRVLLLARAFEPGGGRSVTADASALVSDLPFLVGFKTDGDLGYLTRDSRRTLSWLAIDPAARKTAADALTLQRLETQFVSVLVKQSNGTYRYESRKKEITLSSEPFAIPAAGLQLPLNTATPGSFAYVIRDASGLELNRAEYSVVGQANVTRSLERNAELQITLDKKDYSPGEEMELSIKAPYVGAGLITIERDHVYAAQWFKTDTTASLQKIRLPADFEGNGYVSVQFIRDPGSSEIFTSPLSYGAVPFATSLAARTNPLTLKVPDLIKPGEVLHMHLSSAHPTRAVVYAVDEGILQVARYQAPEPLSEFFKKHALEVKTSQILDLILPEYKRIMAATAPGGDGEAALRRNLNPFKRKHVQPAVYWSGIVDMGREHDFTWTVPDSFNGSLKVFAVAVDDDSIGVAQSKTTVRGDFVLTPNMPVAVAPGDEFEVSVGVANVVAGSGAAADVLVSAKLPPQLEALAPLKQTVSINERSEGVVLFRFRAQALLGAAPVTFQASWHDHAAQLTADLSVRPASPYTTEIKAGFFESSVDVPITRTLYPDHRKLELGVSLLPLVLAGGLGDYLEDYPHLCTEQLVSRGFSVLVSARWPELSRPELVKARAPGEATAALLRVLRSRQNAEGGFGLWAASVETDEFASVYAAHWLLEAAERKEAIPVDLLQSVDVWLQRYAASPVPDDGSAGLAGLRNRAYAAYLLTRQGTVTTPLVTRLRETLQARYAKLWRDDVTAAYLAAVYRLQRQEQEASALMEPLVARLGVVSGQHFAFYYDDSVRDAAVLYLSSRHFPELARGMKPAALQAMVGPVGQGQYNTLSSAQLIMAFDAYASSVAENGFGKLNAEQTIAGGHGGAIDLQGKLILRANYAADANALHFGNHTGVNAYFSVTSAGFDRNPALTELHQGLEILREYVDAAGQPVASVHSGDEITVRLRIRSTTTANIWNVAVTDLLPGGFEPVLPAEPASNGGWRPQFADLREDRVVLYGTITPDLAEYRYRIRATNAGTFLVPPSYAESMYDRSLRARAVASHVTVLRAASP